MRASVCMCVYVNTCVNRNYLPLDPIQLTLTVYHECVVCVWLQMLITYSTCVLTCWMALALQDARSCVLKWIALGTAPYQCLPVVCVFCFGNLCSKPNDIQLDSSG